MPWMRDGAVTWDGIFRASGFRCSSALKDLARLTAVVAFLVLFAYCLRTGWAVLGELGNVKLADCRRVLDVVSVRDAVLCLLGYRVGLELLRAVTRKAAS
jgi:hypothetical protein